MSFTFISTAALCCYIFLFLAFTVAKKNHVIRSFMVVLCVLIVWTAGSMLMRLQFYPGVPFWFYVSVDGLLLLPAALHSYFAAYTGAQCRDRVRLIYLGTAVLLILNTATGGLLIGPPLVTGTGAAATYSYEFGWGVWVLLIFTLLVLLSVGVMIRDYAASDDPLPPGMGWLSAGMLLLRLGNLATGLPLFRGFPIDLLSGVANAVCLFVALWRRRMFKLTLLVSRRTCYFIAGVLAVLLFANCVNPLQWALTRLMPVLAPYTVVIFSVAFTLMTAALYILLKAFVDHVFTREEILQGNRLKEFSNAIAHSIRLEDTLKTFISAIQESMETEKVYVCLLDEQEGNYTLQMSSSPLDSGKLELRCDHPLIPWLQEHPTGLLVQEIRHMPLARGMWETEKQQLQALHIECVLPLMGAKQLVGVALLSGKAKEKSGYTVQDMEYLDSLASVGSMALQNARLYERAYLEARTDELTGLLNRKYFFEALRTACKESAGHELSLVLVDLDDFKLYNQLYGNTEGDAALQSAAQLITGVVGSHGRVARNGGKEFAVLLPRYDTLSATSMAELIRTQLMQRNERARDYAFKRLTASCGVCTMPTAASSWEQLLDHADMAVYSAKRKGKNCVLVYSEEIGAYHAKGGTTAPERPHSDIYAEYAPTICALTAAIDAKDHYTFSHSQNVCYYATELARACGLNDDCIETVKEAALLHDIGKIGIPEEILKKPGRLSNAEYEIMKGHVEQSVSIIRHLPSLDYVIPAVVGHHERYDGKGYPRQLKGEGIPMLARILCVADSFDAMVSRRAYKDACSTEYAVAEVRKNGGTQFDPRLADLFAKLVEDGTIRVRVEGDPSSKLPQESAIIQ